MSTINYQLLYILVSTIPEVPRIYYSLTTYQEARQVRLVDGLWFTWGPQAIMFSQIRDSAE